MTVANNDTAHEAALTRAVLGVSSERSAIRPTAYLLERRFRKVVPPILTGQIVAILTVRDADQSARWYCALLTAEESSRYQSPDGALQVTLRQPVAGLELCLVSRPGLGSDRFDEQHVGLDHLELFVASRGELDRWVAHLVLRQRSCRTLAV